MEIFFSNNPKILYSPLLYYYLAFPACGREASPLLKPDMSPQRTRVPEPGPLKTLVLYVHNFTFLSDRPGLCASNTWSHLSPYSFVSERTYFWSLSCWDFMQKGAFSDSPRGPCSRLGHVQSHVEPSPSGLMDMFAQSPGSLPVDVWSAFSLLVQAYLLLGGQCLSWQKSD